MKNDAKKAFAPLGAVPDEVDAFHGHVGVKLGEQFMEPFSLRFDALARARVSPIRDVVARLFEPPAKSFHRRRRTAEPGSGRQFWAR